MATLQEILTIITETSAKMDEISSDINSLLAAIPPSGGISAEEAEQIHAALLALRDKVSGVADIHNP